jgi:hypothetical protein
MMAIQQKALSHVDDELGKIEFYQINITMRELLRNAGVDENTISVAVEAFEKAAEPTRTRVRDARTWLQALLKDVTPAK